MSEGLVQTLVAFGLSTHEARLFATLSMRGPSSAREAIRESRLDRATSYRVLSRLQARGLVTSDNRWPQTYTPMGVRRLVDRMAVLLKDEIELLQTVRDTCQAGMIHRSEDDETPNDKNGSDGGSDRDRIVAGSNGTQLLANHGLNLERLVRSIQAAEDEVTAVVRLRFLSPTGRSRLARALADALGRRVKVRLVLNYHAMDLNFLAAVRQLRTGTPGDLDVRFFVPQCLHLYVVDRKLAVRFLGFPSPTYHGPEVGVETSEPAFVRNQLSRFRSTWSSSAAARDPSQRNSSQTSEFVENSALVGPTEVRFL